MGLNGTTNATLRRAQQLIETISAQSLSPEQTANRKISLAPLCVPHGH